MGGGRGIFCHEWVVSAVGKAQISDGSGLRHVERSLGMFELSMSNNLSN